MNVLLGVAGLQSFRVFLGVLRNARNRITANTVNTTNTVFVDTVITANTVNTVNTVFVNTRKHRVFKALFARARISV